MNIYWSIPAWTIHVGIFIDTNNKMKNLKKMCCIVQYIIVLLIERAMKCQWTDALPCFHNIPGN